MGCCLFACIGAIWPRIALVFMWLFTYAPHVFKTWYAPLLGFLFLPATTFTYELFMYYGKLNRIEDSVIGMITLAVAFLHDLGQLGMLKGVKDDPGV